MRGSVRWFVDNPIAANLLMLFLLIGIQVTILIARRSSPGFSAFDQLSAMDAFLAFMILITGWSILRFLTVGRRFAAQ